MRYRKGNVVWFRNQRQTANTFGLWHPGIVDEVIEEVVKVNPIEKSTPKTVKYGDVALFQIPPNSDINFQKKVLQKAVSKAQEVSRQQGGVVIQCERLKDNIKDSGNDYDYKEAFLDSLDDDDWNLTKPVESKKKVVVNLKMSAYDLDEEDKENDPLEDQENRPNLCGDSLNPVVKLVRLTQDQFPYRTPLKEIKICPPQKNTPSPVSLKRKFEDFKDMEEDLSDYERIRQQNILERQKFFADLKLMMSKTALAPPKPKPSNVTHRRRFQFISGRSEPYMTRSHSKVNSEGNSSNSSKLSTPKKKIFRFYEEYDSDDDDDDRYFPETKRVSHPKMWILDPNTNILDPNQVTEEMLANVCDKVKDKVYGKNGTSCHQCRQKTLDVKTVCRSGRCVGGRGMFCGVCLSNRYGQDARAALKDPNWMCPPCLDVCNCSICRNRMGKGATGPITWLAQRSGFSNVMDYLEALKLNRKSSLVEAESC